MENTVFSLKKRCNTILITVQNTICFKYTAVIYIVFLIIAYGM